MEVPNFNGMFPQIIQISMICSLILPSSYGGTPIYGNPHGLRVEITPQIQPLVGCERERHGDSPGRGGWKRKWRVSLDRCLVSICDFLDIGDAGRSGTFFQLTL